MLNSHPQFCHNELVSDLWGIRHRNIVYQPILCNYDLLIFFVFAKFCIRQQKYWSNMFFFSGLFFCIFLTFVLEVHTGSIIYDTTYYLLTSLYSCYALLYKYCFAFCFPLLQVTVQSIMCSSHFPNLVISATKCLSWAQGSIQ